MVVPVYRSAEILPELVRRLQDVIPTLSSSYELVLVNDCSPDRSGEVIAELASQHPWIHAINLMRNYGQHNALLCGIRACRHGVIVTMDDDLQHPPEEIPKLLAVFEQGYDVVYGTPAQEQHGLLRDLASLTTKLALQNVMGAEIARQVSAFRVFRAEVANAFTHYAGSFVSIDVLLTWGTNRFAATPVRHEPRAQGISGYTLRKLITHTMNMMTGFSTMPLQIASLVGFAFTLFGFGVLCFVLVRFFYKALPSQAFRFWRRSSLCFPELSCLRWESWASIWHAYTSEACKNLLM